MAIAVSAWFDEALESAIRARWAELAARGISRFLHDGPYRPHVTLGIWEGLEVPALVESLRALLGTRRAFEISFVSVAMFPGEEGVVFLPPRPSEPLHALHRDLHELSRRLGGEPNPLYVPDAWVPHCTMATGGTREEALRACDLLLNLGPGAAGRVTAVGVIDTPAEVELHRIALFGEGSPLC